MPTQKATLAGAVTVAYLLITGCDKSPIQSGATQPPVTGQPLQLKNLADQVDALRGSANIAMNQSTQLLFRVTALEARAYASAVFDPTDTSYQRVDSPKGLGSFAVSVQDVRDFGDGIRVKLNIGNPSSAGFSGVKLKLKYGPRMHISETGTENSLAQIDAWSKSLQTKEVALTEYLQPGRWNSTFVTLPGIRAAGFGYLEVSIETNAINLAAPDN